MEEILLWKLSRHRDHKYTSRCIANREVDVKTVVLQSNARTTTGFVDASIIICCRYSAAGQQFGEGNRLTSWSRSTDCPFIY